MTPPVHCTAPRIVAVIALLGCLLGVVGGLGGCARETRDTDIKLVPIAVVKDRIDRQARGETSLILMVDPRPAKYFTQTHIPGARNITLHEVDPRSKIDPEIDRFKNIVVYGDDPASPEARGMTKRLLAVGYSGVRFFAGGMNEWTGRGYAVEGSGPSGAAAPAAASP